MGVLLNKATRILVQGITGTEGQRAAAAMKAFGSNIIAGVTPGKGGQVTAQGLPVYDSVAKAIAVHGKFDASYICVPPLHATAATMESINAGIPLIAILTEAIPLSRVWSILHEARARGLRILGPASVGVLVPGESLLGIVSVENAGVIYQPGPIGIISKSGGMANDLAWTLRQNGLGQSAVVSIGGELLKGFSVLDVMQEFESDDKTKVVLYYGEAGGQDEIILAQAVANGKINKPIVAYIAGRGLDLIAPERTFGHAGTFMGAEQESAKAKMRLMAEVGITLVENFEDLISKVKYLYEQA